MSTFAGIPGVAGAANGPKATATFSAPTGITLYYDELDSRALVIFVADTGNHVIRVIRQTYGNSSVWMVDTWAGGGPAPQDGIGPSGLRDGFRNQSLFTSPHGIDVDDNGYVFVADSGNNVIRMIDPNGNVTTLAGTVVPMKASTATNRLPENGGCPDPCVAGVAGYEDGPRDVAKFNYPYDVSLGPNQTVRCQH